MALIDEIREQPVVAARLLDSLLGEPLDRLRASVAARRPTFVLIAARGSSDHAALYAQYLFSIRNDLIVSLATPSTITLYGARPRLSEALVIGISQSGQSPDIVAVLDEAARQGAPTIAVTNEPDSPLAGAADELIDINAGPERATAATKTYTAQLLAMALMSCALDAPSPSELADLARVPDLMRDALGADDAARAVAAGHGARERAIVLGRGYSYATAREWTLKLQELTQLPALPFSAADFEHGPLALAEPGLPLLAVAPSGPALAGQLALLERLRADHGARLTVVSDDPAARALDEGLPLPSDVPPWLSPLIEIVPAQLYTYHLAFARGLDPDKPRTINKVTHTT